MALRGLLISFQELNIVKEEDLERFVMEDGLTELLDSLCHEQVQIVNLDLFLADSTEKVKLLLSVYQLKPEECLIITATQKVLALILELPIASIGYLNPRYPGQDLTKAQVLVEGFDEVDFFFLQRVYQRRHGIPWTIMETQRCVLREMTVADLERLYQLYRGNNITKYMESLYEDHKKEEEYTKAYIENMYRFYGYGMWLVLEKSTRKIIGRAGLNNFLIHQTPSLEMGYMIGEAYQNQGYATEVCRGILQFAAEETEFETVNCLIEKGNESSIHLMDKLEFVWAEEIKVKEKNMQRYMKKLHF
ncbi:MAG: GNAT family N-acetyltransferase [Lachnospiraceae bacterium]